MSSTGPRRAHVHPRPSVVRAFGGRRRSKAFLCATALNVCSDRDDGGGGDGHDDGNGNGNDGNGDDDGDGDHGNDDALSVRGVDCALKANSDAITSESTACAHACRVALQAMKPSAQVWDTGTVVVRARLPAVRARSARTRSARKRARHGTVLGEPGDHGRRTPRCRMPPVRRFSGHLSGQRGSRRRRPPQRQVQQLVDPRHVVDGDCTPEVVAEFLVDVLPLLLFGGCRRSGPPAGGSSGFERRTARWSSRRCLTATVCGRSGSRFERRRSR